MTEDLSALLARTEAELAAAADLRALDAVRVAVLGKSGSLTALLKGLGTVPAEQRKDRGAALNRLKGAIEAALDARRVVLDAAALDARLAAERMDVTLPPRPFAAGTAAEGGIHPIARTMEELTALFGAMGFAVAEGPDIESDWHNFGALNIPDHHPARQDHDTFYLPEANGRRPVLRTHTSPVQIRTMITQAPPIRVIVPGRTYRADHDATHSPMFHQVEGLVIDRGITLGHLKGCLVDFLRAFFGISDLPVRFRSSYFPFTEPSMEVDIGWSRKTGELGQGGDWLEILGSGMVHPKVLANCGIDPREWQGFAFGMGIERITMLKHGIPDLRPFYEADIRWLRHYASSPLAPATLHEGV
ncbi:phenylalanine--tRNA ligase subunit alpha [Roseomonas sp. PWR1]|uniref:Phenylalanine--tRNA ligase alpha subunit n=1 Tax=Roseomonas nitratireducens TaxID=2820810 RepID=A0ABS4ART6_9PROT|nr:phenylalanine--tRNA ligase subunit alpha [Neoroseomonas nitratireducens]MBP0463588.1 phenylalanine--tRNA ligase subunit alpha [Neoroseomonas nitratireducens]